MELDEYGKRVWKHKSNKRLFLEQSYRWKERLVLIDETEGRQVVGSFMASTFDYGAWVPMTQGEFDSVKSKYGEIYNQEIQSSRESGVNVKKLPGLVEQTMKNEKWWNGFLVGFFIGGVIGIVILDLVQRGIL